MTWPWTRRRTPQIEPWEALIRPPRQLYAGHDESLRKRTEARRDTAKRLRDRAALVESGEPLHDQIRRVR
jgi:hypothetical protein